MKNVQKKLPNIHRNLWTNDLFFIQKNHFAKKKKRRRVTWARIYNFKVGMRVDPLVLSLSLYYSSWFQILSITNIWCANARKEEGGNFKFHILNWLKSLLSFEGRSSGDQTFQIIGSENNKGCVPRRVWQFWHWFTSFMGGPFLGLMD